MGYLHSPPAHLDGSHRHRGDTQILHEDEGPHHVYKRVGRAHFVEMYLLDRAAVDARLHFRQTQQGGRTALLHPGGQGAPSIMLCMSARWRSGRTSFRRARRVAYMRPPSERRSRRSVSPRQAEGHLRDAAPLPDGGRTTPPRSETPVSPASPSMSAAPASSSAPSNISPDTPVQGSM